MNILDMRTVIFSSVISSSICTAIMLLLWLWGRRRSPELGLWLADYIMQWSAVLLIALRGFVPDFLSMVVANMLIVGGTILLFIGLERNVGKISSQYPNFILLCVFFGVHSFFAFVQPNLLARTLNASLGLLIICLQCVWLLLHRVDPKMRNITMPVGVIFLAYSLVAIVRSFLQFTVPQSNDFFKSGLSDTLAILIYQMLFIGLTFALFLMVNRQLFAVLERDIIKRKLTEDALRESEEKLSIAFRSIPDAIAITSIEDSKFIETNDSFYRISEYSKEEVIGKSTLELDLWADLTDRDKFLELLKNNGSVTNFEADFQKKSGEKISSLVSGQVFRWQGLLCVLTMIRDVSERKKVELSLRQRLMDMETVDQLSKTMRVANTLDELLKIFLDETLNKTNSVDGCIQLFDPATNKLKRYVTRGWFNALADIAIDTDEGIPGLVFSTNQPHVSLDIKNDDLLLKRFYDLVPVNRSGAYIPIQSSKGILGVLSVSVPQPQTIGENELRLLTIISQLGGNAIQRTRLNEQVNIANEELHKEIDQRRLVQSLLADEKELLSTTLMCIGEGVIVTDEDDLIILFNQSAETLTGYSASEVFKKPFRDVFHIYDPETQQAVTDVIAALHKMNELQKKGISYRSPTLMSRSGDKILVSSNIESFKSKNGEEKGHVIVFQNVTEKIKAEAQTLFSQKMEAIGQLAAGIAHEINTPIQYVGDNLRFLNKSFSRTTEMLDIYQKAALDHLQKRVNQEDIDYLEDAKRQRKISYYLDEIPKAVEESLEGIERVRKIVLAMREFSHPSDKEMKLSNINHGIETTIVISRNEWKYCADLETHLDPDLPLVHCLIDEINQVVLNMIVNAAQAIQETITEGSGEKGRIDISTSRDENKVLIKIQDTGCGIPDAIAERVFEPFFTTKGVGKGTGQGLSMAYNIIVSKHHGKINVESEPGIGSTFTIELPLDAPAKE